MTFLQDDNSSFVKPPKQTVLIFGKDGQVGWELEQILLPFGNTVALNRAQCDLGNADQLIKAIRTIKPSLIINAAANTAVDRAETEQQLAFSINATAPGIMAEEAKKIDALLIHYSTDYVFDGTASSPYTETQLTHPINFYGKSKLAGEEAIQQVGGKHLIFRTSWVYGMRGKNFLLTMLKLAKEKPSLKVIDDQIGSPTWSRFIAQTTVQIATSMAMDRENPWGIYNLTNSGYTSWHGFAAEIFQLSKLAVDLKAIPSAEYPTPAKRPAYSILSHDKIKKVFNISPPTWQEALNLCLNQNN